MVEIGLAIVFVGLLLWAGKYLYPAIQLASELKAMYKSQGYWFPDEW